MNMEKWRFLEINWLTYAETAIYRPVLMRARSEGIVPDTVSFCTFPKPSMITTFFNDPEKDINLTFCKERKIPIFRTIASGGPIFGDTGYIFTFLHLARENPKVPPNAEMMFEKTLTGIASGISEHFNVECRFRPLNDVELKCEDGIWRKIGPSSCFYEERAIQMGSGIQVKKPDVNLIAQTITPPAQKFADKQTSSIQERITYLENVVGRTIDLNEIKEIYIDQIEKIFEIELIPGELTDKEKDYYREMEREYTSDEFFMERSERRFGKIPSDVTRKMMQFKVPEGPMVRIITLVKDNKIWGLLISGAIHASPLRPTSPIHEIEKALKGQAIDEKVFESKIAEILNRPNFNLAKVSAPLLAGKIFECATSPPPSPSPLEGEGRGEGANIR
jgi:lipoate-protein ligase A